MGDYDDIGKAVAGTLKALLVFIVILVPLGLWKIIDIFNLIVLNH